MFLPSATGRRLQLRPSDMAAAPRKGDISPARASRFSFAVPWCRSRMACPFQFPDRIATTIAGGESICRCTAQQ
jgi:hypothetical protein